MKTAVHYYKITKGSLAHQTIKVIIVKDSTGEDYHVCDSKHCQAYTKDAFNGLVERWGLVQL